MPPTAQVYDTRADVYSWGVLLAELVTQKPPYDGVYFTPVQVRHRDKMLRNLTLHLGSVILKLGTRM